MILAEKITELRKRSGLSQEEFGAEIGVSRQAVSKWEMAQTTPDLNKIMIMSEFFGVSTDFLLKDKYDLDFLDTANHAEVQTDKPDATTEETVAAKNRIIELIEVQDYITVRKKTAVNLVIAIILFFISPFPGIYITTFDEKHFVVGLLIQIIIFIIVAVIVILSVWNLSKYNKLWHDDAELAYGVRGFVTDCRKEFEHTFLLGIIIGTVCLLASVIPMMIVSGFTDTDNLAIAVGGCIMLLIFALGTSCITYVLTINHGYKIILRKR